MQRRTPHPKLRFPAAAGRWWRWSAKSPHAIQDWPGGDRIAIHSTPDTSSIGLPVSHGCMRLTVAEAQWLLDHIPLGTPTLISS